MVRPLYLYFKIFCYLVQIVIGHLCKVTNKSCHMYEIIVVRSMVRIVCIYIYIHVIYISKYIWINICIYIHIMYRERYLYIHTCIQIYTGVYICMYEIYV